jgi:hypothetical protein
MNYLAIIILFYHEEDKIKSKYKEVYFRENL